MSLRAGGRTTRAFAVMLVLTAVALLGSTVVLSLSMLQQTRALDDRVTYTQEIVVANFRTFSQLQRELLLLQLLFRTDAPVAADEAALRESLVSQRVGESTLAWQSGTLGSDELLAQAERLEQDWTTRVRPLVAESTGATPAALAAREDLRREVDRLEKEYNQVISAAENNRRRLAGDANQDAQELVDRANSLLLDVAITFTAVVAFLGFGGALFAVFHRQRERANQALLDLNAELQRYAHVVRATDNMVVVTDRRGLIEWVNPSFEAATGFTLEQCRGRSPGDLLQGPGTDRETVYRIGQAVSRGEPFSADLVNYAQDGREFWISLDATPLHDEHGKLSGFVAVQRDITERLIAERLLRDAKESAEATAREKATFLASMSHEIRTPLNAVLGLTDLLLRTDLDEVQRDYVDTAHRSGTHLLALVNDILDFSALEAGRIAPEDESFDVRGLVDDVLGMFARDAARAGVFMRSSIADDVPRAVMGDEMRVRQILINLVGNGVKFTPRGSVHLDVTRSRPDDGPETLRFSVHDTGIGMSPDQLARVFRPFIQGDPSTTRRFGGTGLGLAICRLLAERLGGTISVSSEIGQGSTFTVDLPLREAAGAADRPAADGDSVSLEGLRVLLAEDDEVNQTIARHMLRRLGLEADLARHGQEVVDLASAVDYDIVLMDVHMPGMDGVQATSALRELLPCERRPWIVAVTANALEGDRAVLLEAGMDDYVSKPFLLDDLERALRRGARHRRIRGPAEDSAGTSPAPGLPAGSPGRT